MKVIVFSSESYVSDSFNAVNQGYGYKLTFHKMTLTMDNVCCGLINKDTQFG
ncbi:MAG: hypothetical protein K2P98_07140 [Neisseriaceae bacterium]|nr:hypothetical protein [Neisseriaceae bacterium]